MIGEILLKSEKFFEHNGKNSSEKFLPLPRNRKKTKIFHLVMMLITMFTPYQNPSNFVVSHKSKPKSA